MHRLVFCTLLAGAAFAQSNQEKQLLDRIDQLEKRLAQLEERSGVVPASSATAVSTTSAASAQPVTPAAQVAAAPSTADKDRSILDYLRDSTVNVTIDGYYSYNFNDPIGRINLLRVYDASSNSFSLNQADLIIERTPDIAGGRRWGARLDLMFGQATEVQQGSLLNEPRPQAYRNVYQAFGTYVVPLGKGLSVDFGKFASSIGFEGNFTKDQMNYSRSYLFSLLPFYHFGFRTGYTFNDRLSAGYWLVNGIGQSEDFNRDKSQNFTLTVKPAKSLSWTWNYYTGIENPPIVGQTSASGRTHIIDTNAAWNATAKLTFAGQFDYVINRVRESAPPAHVTGGAGYARYQFTPKFAMAARGEYLSNRGGLFSELNQALKETTLTTDFKLAEGFLIRGEWRIDFSNQPFFLTSTPGVFKQQQNTATLGLTWWFGRKEGAW